jgi:hypothetical protein
VGDTLKVIYVAGTVEQAHLLRNALVDLGIEAHVNNDSLRYAVGELPAGWPTAARVVVHESDAEDARRIALAFDRMGSERALGAADLPDESDETEHDEPDWPWPCCPSCGKPRLTSCPICETSGTSFPQAYHPQSDEPDDVGKLASGSEPQSPAESARESRLTVICPTCDEPFSPAFPARCEWCGYRFADGVELTAPQAPPIDSTEFNLRVAVVIVGLVAAMLGAFVYFAMLTAPR